MDWTELAAGSGLFLEHYVRPYTTMLVMYYYAIGFFLMGLAFAH